MVIIRTAAILSIALALGATAQAQPVVRDSQAIVEFQRTLDAYAFQHRQVERRVGATADERAMATGMRAARASAQDGDIFTPLVAAAFRERINHALRAGACSATEAGVTSSIVPRPNQDATGTTAIAACVSSALPRLPVELQYRVAGVVLVLVDTHANLVVDVLHGAFRQPDMR